MKGRSRPFSRSTALGVGLLPPSLLTASHGEVPHVPRPGLGLFPVAWLSTHLQPCPPNLLPTQQPE